MMSNKPDSTLKERLNNIDLNFERIKNKKEKIEELKFEIELIEKEIIEKTKNLEYANESKYTAYRNDDFKLAWIYNMQEVKDKKLEKTFKEIEHLISFVFLNENTNFKLTNIISFGYGWAYDFYYKYKNKTIVIRIPMFNTACKENIYYLLQGYTLYEEINENSQNEIIESFDTQTIKKAIEDWRIKNDS